MKTGIKKCNLHSLISNRTWYSFLFDKYIILYRIEIRYCFVLKSFKNTATLIFLNHIMSDYIPLTQAPFRNKINPTPSIWEKQNSYFSIFKAREGKTRDVKSLSTSDCWGGRFKKVYNIEECIEELELGSDNSFDSENTNEETLPVSTEAEDFFIDDDSSVDEDELDDVDEYITDINKDQYVILHLGDLIKSITKNMVCKQCALSGNTLCSCIFVDSKTVGFATNLSFTCSADSHQSKTHNWEVQPRVRKDSMFKNKWSKRSNYEVNLLSVIACHQVGWSYYTLNRFFAFIGIKSMGQLLFSSCEQIIGKATTKIAEESMHEAREKEK